MAKNSEIVDAEVSRIFNKIDTNGDGKICATELRQLLLSLGTETTSEEVNNIMKEMDKDGDGYVDLVEFSEFHFASGGNAGTASELRDAFAMFDKDGDGKITARELHSVLRSLGDDCSLNDCEKMIQCVDVDGDGCVDFSEFEKMMNNGLLK